MKPKRSKRVLSVDLGELRPALQVLADKDRRQLGPWIRLQLEKVIERRRGAEVRKSIHNGDQCSSCVTTTTGSGESDPENTSGFAPTGFDPTTPSGPVKGQAA